MITNLHSLLFLDLNKFEHHELVLKPLFNSTKRIEPKNETLQLKLTSKLNGSIDFLSKQLSNSTQEERDFHNMFSDSLENNTHQSYFMCYPGRGTRYYTFLTGAWIWMDTLISSLIPSKIYILFLNLVDFFDSKNFFNQ